MGQCAAMPKVAPSPSAAFLQSASLTMGWPWAQPTLPTPPDTIWTCSPPPQAQHASTAETPPRGAQSLNSPLSDQPSPLPPDLVHHWCNRYSSQVLLVLLLQSLGESRQTTPGSWARKATMAVSAAADRRRLPRSCEGRGHCHAELRSGAALCTPISASAALLCGKPEPTDTASPGVPTSNTATTPQCRKRRENDAIGGAAVFIQRMEQRPAISGRQALV
mmetsp:Transcript_303/g.1089  ORF Transcript_303/g.1089 Transcript_303/m.1089 type:complete len:220 (+) Transcript_303:831-1490(+)